MVRPAADWRPTYGSVMLPSISTLYLFVRSGSPTTVTESVSSGLMTYRSGSHSPFAPTDGTAGAVCACVAAANARMIAIFMMTVLMFIFIARLRSHGDQRRTRGTAGEKPV